jgi:hypothetical protein
MVRLRKGQPDRCRHGGEQAAGSDDRHEQPPRQPTCWRDDDAGGGCASDCVAAGEAEREALGLAGVSAEADRRVLAGLLPPAVSFADSLADSLAAPLTETSAVGADDMDAVGAGCQGIYTSLLVEVVCCRRALLHNFSISLGGFGTGEGQSHDAHFGHAGDRLRRNRCVDYDPGR